MRDRRRNYEIMVIMSPLSNTEEDITANINRVQQAITTLGGEVTNIDRSAPWGRRKLAYPIRAVAEGETSRRSFSEGIYALLNFSLLTSQVPELDRVLKLNDSVLRHMLLVIEPNKASAARAAVAAAGGSTIALGDADDASSDAPDTSSDDADADDADADDADADDADADADADDADADDKA